MSPGVPIEAPISPVKALKNDNEYKVALAFPDVPVMVEIARAESSFDEYATNPGSSAKGLFQILDGTWKSAKCTGSVFNPNDNIACAAKIYDASGTQPWISSKSAWGK